MRCAVEAMGAYLIFRKTDGIYEVFKSVELKRSQPITLAHLLYHLTVAAASRHGILFKVSVWISFEFFNDAACKKLHLRFGGGEI